MPLERDIEGDIEGLSIDHSRLALEVISGGIVVPPANALNLAAGVYRSDMSAVEGSSLVRGAGFRFKPVAPAEAVEIDERRERVLFGGYYFNHFGHFVTETVARLWAFAACENVDKIIFVPGDGSERKRHGFFSALFPKESPEIEVVDDVCKFAEVIVPQPGFMIRKSFNSNYWSWLREVSQRLLECGEHNSIDTPLYLSRSNLDTTRRYAYGEKELEAGLRNAGVLVVHPEEHTFAEQVAMIAKHSTIIGLEGSQLHSMMFTAGRKRCIQLDYRKVNPNYYLIDRTLENTAHYPLLWRPPSYEEFHFANGVSEPYIFDPQRAADAIGQIIGAKVCAPKISRKNRREFAVNWISWWGRKSFAAFTFPGVKPPALWGKPPRVWGITAQQYQKNVRCALQSL